MTGREFEKLGPFIAAIGKEGARIVGGNPDGLYIYIEAMEGVITASIFRDEGNAVRYFKWDEDFIEAVSDAWYAPEPNKRWSVMEYEVTGKHFDASFAYPEEVDIESFDIDRREIALQKRYGDKPRIYPPISKGAVEWK
ncbi:hypothetical protein BH10PSE13_BH10PSE13_20340 [soil metagenome]